MAIASEPHELVMVRLASAFGLRSLFGQVRGGRVCSVQRTVRTERPCLATNKITNRQPMRAVGASVT